MTLAADTALRAPFPWHGGKRRVAGEVWSFLGDVGRYIEPFAGSLGVLLGRPGGAPSSGLEIANDLDGYIANVWRALRDHPRETIAYADDLRSELDLTAKHLWLVNEGRDRLKAGLQTDPSWSDTQVAGWWLYGVALWIGDAFASGTGPWTREALGGTPGTGTIKRQMPHAGNDGRGVHRGSGGSGTISDGVYRLADALSHRLRRVLVTSGAWERVLTPTTSRAASGITGIYIDAPYRDHTTTYASNDETGDELWGRINAYAHSRQPHRIVISGYDGDLDVPDGWRTVPYTARGSSSANRTNEVFWVSSNCLGQETLL